MAWSRARAAGVSLLVSAGVIAAGNVPVSAAPQERVLYRQWASARDFAAGTSEGASPDGSGALTISRPAGTTTYQDPFGGAAKKWEYARWTSPPVRLGFGASQLIASWTAATPHGSWLQVEMSGRTSAGADTKWYVMGRWAADDPGQGGDIHRTSVPKQADANGDVQTDTFAARKPLASYRLRVTLYRLPGGRARPSLRSVGAVASFVPNRASVPVSPLGGAEGVELKVPAYSQDIHVGEYPQYDGGGEAWCSPTSTSMVLGYWGRGPSKRDLSWVNPSYADPQVDNAARATFDYAYKGAGNWPFNPAYAARYGLRGFITRLHSVNELERFIKAGIPVVTAQSFKAAEMPGAGYSTNGHLFVVVGFTKSGDPIVNDPASRSDSAVRHVYPRASFENVWLRSSSSGGVAYVMYPPDHRLPANVPGPDRNW
jgi:hypothetical protein